MRKGREAIGGAWFADRARFFQTLVLRIEAREGFVSIDWRAGQGSEQPSIAGPEYASVTQSMKFFV